MDPAKARGVLNNNPGNLDRAPTPWNYEIRDPNDPRLSAQQKWELTQGRFCVFPEEHWGIRALVLNLKAYGRTGRNTVRKVITSWAPPGNQDFNNTEAYIAHVCEIGGFKPDDPIDFTDWAQMRGLTVGIITHENGGNPYPESDIEDGLRLAGVIKPVTVATSTTAKGAVVATTATAAGAAVSSASDTINSTLDALVPIGDIEFIKWLIIGLKVLLLVTVLVGIGLMLRERLKREARDRKVEKVDTPEITEPVTAGGVP